jgi:Nickel responsive protein SCO4226-like
VLLRRFCDDHGDLARSFWGACDALLTPGPLGPLFDIADATGGELQELVASKARPHEVAGALLRELGRRVPAILVLEDVHWADEATLDVLRLLGRRIPIGARGADLCRAVVERNGSEGVTWLSSYVSEDKGRTFCVYDAPNPKAIRKTAARNELPVAPSAANDAVADDQGAFGDAAVDPDSAPAGSPPLWTIAEALGYRSSR